MQPHILASKLENENVVILDIRSDEEFGVSHIEGAQLVDYENFDIEDLASIDKEAEIIVYCSVGYRSERVGEKLIDRGYQNVNNLYGGIFQWKNTDYQVVNDNGTTDSVHTYNRSWSKWLTKGIKVYE